LPLESGPIFQGRYENITFSASLPSAVKNLDSLEITLRILNKSGVNFVIRDFTQGLLGFDFHLINVSQKEVEAADRLKNARRVYPSAEGQPYALNGGWSTTVLAPGRALTITLPLKQFLPVKSVGEYTLHVCWRDSKAYGQMTWVPSATPKVQFGGKILLQQSGNSILISVAK
jgi:hypothetical protein